jgi:hypothetical protein
MINSREISIFYFYFPCFALFFFIHQVREAEELDGFIRVFLLVFSTRP